MSDQVIVPEVITDNTPVTIVEPEKSEPVVVEIVPTEEPTITEEDLQALVDAVMKEVEEPVPLGPQFPTDSDPLSDAIGKLDELVDKTVQLEQEKEAKTTEITTLTTQIDELQKKVDFVDAAYEKISSVIGDDLAQKIINGEADAIPKYLIPGNMEKVLADKVLGPLVSARLEGKELDIPKFLSDIVSAKKLTIPNIKSEPVITPKTNTSTNLTEEISRLSHSGF